EPSPLWEPRAWAVMLLVLLAMLPIEARGRTTPSAVVPELAWLSFSLLSITWAPDLEFAQVQGIDLVLLIIVGAALARLNSSGRTEQLADTFRVAMLVVLMILMAT